MDPRSIADQELRLPNLRDIVDLDQFELAIPL
jgi:hypothetical protein